MNTADMEGYVIGAAIVIALAVKASAFVSALLWPAEAYTAAGRLSKARWLLILGAGLGFQVLFLGALPIHPLHLAASVAAIVFLVDVRPAISQGAAAR